MSVACFTVYLQNTTLNSPTMKQNFYVALWVVASMHVCSPAVAQHFACAQYETDAKRWQEIEQVFQPQGWTQWALAVKDAFPLNNDRSIRYQYVLASDEACSQKRLTEMVQNWVSLEHPNALPLPVAQTVDLKVQALWDDIAHSNRLFSATSVTAKAETFLEFKENRLRVTVTVTRYVLGAAGPFHSNADTQQVSECFPFDLNGKWKNVMAMAYVNSNQKALNQVGRLLDYLNRQASTSVKTDKDW